MVAVTDLSTVLHKEVNRSLPVPPFQMWWDRPFTSVHLARRRPLRCSAKKQTSPTRGRGQQLHITIHCHTRTKMSRCGIGQRPSSPAFMGTKPPNRRGRRWAAPNKQPELLDSFPFYCVTPLKIPQFSLCFGFFETKNNVHVPCLSVLYCNATETKSSVLFLKLANQFRMSIL